MSDILLPIATALISVIIAAVLTIHIKFASSKEEAMKGVNKLIYKTIICIWFIWLVHQLYNEINSTEPLTRTDVFSIASYSASLAFMLMLVIVNRILGVIENVVDIQGQHISSTNRIMDIVEDNENGFTPI